MARLPLFAIIAVFGAIAIASPDGDRGDVASDEWKAPRRDARRKNPISADEKSIGIGKRVYVAECADCHGDTGIGDGPGASDLERPAGNLADSSMWNQADGELFWKIKVGREPMPAYEELITEDEVWHVVNYIRTLAPRSDQSTDDRADDEASTSSDTTTQPSNNE